MHNWAFVNRFTAQNFRFLKKKQGRLTLLEFFTVAAAREPDYFFGSIFSRPPMYGRSTSGILSEPSFCW